MHRILTSMISVLIAHQHELDDRPTRLGPLEPNSRQCVGLEAQSNTRYSTGHSYDPQYALAAYTWVAVDVECCFRCVCLVVCVNLWPKTAISRSEQNRYGWRRRTLYGAADKILRRLMAAARGSSPNTKSINIFREGGRSRAKAISRRLP